MTWTTLELAVAMICACLPAIRNLLVRLYPKAFLTSMRTTEANRSGAAGWYARSKQLSQPEDGAFYELQRTATEESTRLPTVSAKDSTINTCTSEEEWSNGSTKNKPLSRVEHV